MTTQTMNNLDQLRIDLWAEIDRQVAFAEANNLTLDQLNEQYPELRTPIEEMMHQIESLS